MQGSCNKFVSKALNWNSAKSTCQALGSKLVVINSKAEQQAIGSIIPNNQNSWIGLYRNPKDKSRFLWVDGSPVSYTYWYRGEPNSLQEECVHMNSQAYSLRWNDLRCTYKLPYLCEANKRGKGLFVIF